MIEHLKIKHIKGLRECKLEYLGKINVICGKNNSGKSTIFEGIANPESVAFGKSWDESLIKTVCDGIRGEKWPEESNIGRAILQLIKQIVKEKEIWYSDEKDDFLMQFNSIIESDRQQYSGSISNNSQLTKVFNTIYVTEPAIILLPPKRNFDCTTQVKADERIAEWGHGILNYLFYAKNQASNDKERKVFEEISRAFYEVSSGYKFEIFLQQNNHLQLCIAYEETPWINAADCGLGLLDLLVILYFSAHPQYGLVLIEEPESHMHPDMQRKLLYHLKERTTEHKQFILTTHSNVFVNNALVDNVFLTRFTHSVTVTNAFSKVALLNELGYSVTDNLVSDLVILVEGPTDKPVLEEFLVKMGLFSKYDIKIWPLGGDIMDQLDLTVFTQSHKIIALVDSDPGSNRIRKRFTDKCKSLNIPVHRLERYALENYFTLPALRAVFGTQISSDIDTIEPRKKLEEQIGMDVKKNNWKIAREMKLEDIAGNDFHKFLLEVQKLCES